MNLKTDFQDDIAQVFLDPAEFGEEIDIDGTPVTAVMLKTIYRNMRFMVN